MEGLFLYRPPVGDEGPPGHELFNKRRNGFLGDYIRVTLQTIYIVMEGKSGLPFMLRRWYGYAISLTGKG